MQDRYITQCFIYPNYPKLVDQITTLDKKGRSKASIAYKGDKSLYCASLYNKYYNSYFQIHIYLSELFLYTFFFIKDGDFSLFISFQLAKKEPDNRFYINIKFLCIQAINIYHSIIVFLFNCYIVLRIKCKTLYKIRKCI